MESVMVAALTKRFECGNWFCFALVGSIGINISSLENCINWALTSRIHCFNHEWFVVIKWRVRGR